ncbi:MAG: hypothetical protein ACNYZH_08825 [Acidimicrobiia bacterium]
MKRAEGRRTRGMPADLGGAALAFLFEVIIVIGLATAALLVAAVITAVN